MSTCHLCGSSVNSYGMEQHIHWHAKLDGKFALLEELTGTIVEFVTPQGFEVPDEAQ